MKIVAAGDALIQRRIPANHPGADGIRAWVQAADARYFNLETTIFARITDKNRAQKLIQNVFQTPLGTHPSQSW